MAVTAAFPMGCVPYFGSSIASVYLHDVNYRVFKPGT
jgi:hypothetical protein